MKVKKELRKKVIKIIKELAKDKDKHKIAVQPKAEPFKALVSCILSLRTKDEVTIEASKRLFKIASTPNDIMKLSIKRIEELIYPVGFYKRKARTIKNIAKIIHQKYNDKVPNNINELIKIKGIGRKTANIVLSYAYGKAVIAVDTHVHRISNRLGLVKTKTPEQTEQALMEIVPKKYRVLINELFVKHGKSICRPISPKCSICPISKYCKKVNVKKHR